MHQITVTYFGICGVTILPNNVREKKRKDEPCPHPILISLMYYVTKMGIPSAATVHSHLNNIAFVIHETALK